MKRVLLALAMGLGLAFPAAAGTIAVRGETVYTMAGAPIKNGVVLVKDGKIAAVGPVASVTIPAGTRTVSAKVVTPGLVDAHSTLGLSGIYNAPQDQGQLEKSNAMQPDLRAIDGYNPREPLVEWVRGFGVTTVHTGPGPGSIAGGQSMIVKTVGGTVEEATVKPAAMAVFTLGPGISQNYKTPGTRTKGVAMLREGFVKAQNYAKKRQATPDTPEDLAMEVMAQVLDGKLPALITAQSATDIVGALRLAEEFKFKLVLDGAAEGALVADAIKRAGVPVIVHPTMVRPVGETKSASLEDAAVLRRAGIPIALQSGYEGYVPKTRVILFEAAEAAANGLPFEQALASITADAARVIGVADRVGALAPGMDGDLALFDGDPFEYTTHVCTVIVAGEVVSDRCR